MHYLLWNREILSCRKEYLRKWKGLLIAVDTDTTFHLWFFSSFCAAFQIIIQCILKENADLFFFFLRSNAVYLICITHSAGLCPFTTQMWWIYQVLFWGGSKSRRTKNNFWVSLFFLVAPVAFIWAVLSSITGVSHLPLGLCDDAVLCGCKLLLVAGGRHVPVHAAGTFSVFWAKNFSSLSLHWLG